MVDVAEEERVPRGANRARLSGVVAGCEWPGAHGQITNRSQLALEGSRGLDRSNRMGGGSRPLRPNSPRTRMLGILLFDASTIACPERRKFLSFHDVVTRYKTNPTMAGTNFHPSAIEKSPGARPRLPGGRLRIEVKSLWGGPCELRGRIG